MTIVSASHLGDCLTIRNLRLFKLDLNLLVILKTPLQCAEVELTLSVNDGLLQFLRLFNNPCRIFLTHTQDSRHQFLHL